MSMSKEESLLDVALNDPVRKKYGLNIIFADKHKKPLMKDWNKWITQKQTDEDVSLMFKKQHINYGYLTGFNGLITIDFDAAWIYLEALEYFGDRLNTYTVKTPNGGYHAYFIVKHPETYVEYKKSLKVEILGNYNTIVYGKAETVEGKMGTYVAINKEPIRVDEDIIGDMKKFLRETLTKFDFLTYKCIEKKLEKKINHLTHEQRLDISNLFLQKKADMTTAVNFFRMCSDFDPKISRYQLQKTQDKIDAGKLKYPKCGVLRKDFNFPQSECDGCIRLLKKDRKPKKAKKAVSTTPDGEVRVMTPDRLYEEIMNMNRRITHGMHHDPDYGLMFTTKIEGQVGVYGITKRKFIKAIHEDELDGVKVDKSQMVVKGYTSPLSPLTQTAIVKLSKTVGKKDKYEYEKMSEIFEDLLDKIVFYYLDFREPAEAFLVALWILGTYFRVFWIWYPYITFAGLRDVGKSTSLTVMANACYNGSGYVSGSSSEASILRRAASSKGIVIVDHYEEIKKNPEKRQVYTQLLENAWRLNASVERVNTNTFEIDVFNIPCSIAIGTRYEDEVLDEKGIKITMYDTSNEDIVERSSELDEDPYFLNIQQRIMAMSLMYQYKVVDAYKSIPRIPGLFGRDRNKFKPLLAMAQVIDDETGNKWKLFDKISAYGVEYRKNRKQDVTDLEEVLLKMILEWNIPSATYSQIATRMKKEGFFKYGWQTARTDIRKLGIIKSIDRRKRPHIVYFDINKAKERAESRGIEWQVMGSQEDYDEDGYADEAEYEDDYEDDDHYNKETLPDSRINDLSVDLNSMQTEIVKIVNTPAHQVADNAVMVSKVVDIIEALYEVSRDTVEATIDDLKDMKKIYEPRMGFIKIRK